MPQPNLLIFAVDGLRASALGAYGNTSFPTPALDEFAADSFLLDACYAPSSDLTAIYRALWQSIHPLRPDSSSVAALALPRLFADAGYRTTLITDEPQLLDFPAAVDFEQHVQVNGMSAVRATDVSQTALARIFAAAAESVRPQDRPQLIWLHTRGMHGPWDVPLDLQESLLDEGDPPPVTAVEPPDMLSQRDCDPDLVFRYACAYAAQIMVLDACWDSLMGAVESQCTNRDASTWCVTLLGARGFPLGEHHRVGGVDARLYGDQLHVPWLLRFSDGCASLTRSPHLVSHFDLLPTLAATMNIVKPGSATLWDGANVRSLAEALTAPWRDALVSADKSGSRVIRTARWSLRNDVVESEPSSLESLIAEPRGELFVRPDDRWEANDVAALCPEIVADLERALDETQRRIGSGDPLLLTNLPNA